MTKSEAIAQLKTSILAAETLGELYALMEDYSYQEFLEVYNELTPTQQAALDEICDRDINLQITAINTAKRAEALGKLSNTNR
ncbi:MAG TPA: hypothetical protein V6D43_26030 [Candidatus Sericytochromatia bacterium]